MNYEMILSHPDSSTRTFIKMHMGEFCYEKEMPASENHFSQLSELLFSPFILPVFLFSGRSKKIIELQSQEVI